MAKTRYVVELKPDFISAQFMSKGTAVELSDSKRVFETDDENEYHGIRELPFLKDLSEEPKAKASKDGDE